MRERKEGQKEKEGRKKKKEKRGLGNGRVSERGKEK